MKELTTKERDSTAKPAKSCGKRSITEDAFTCFSPQKIALTG
jgi:hypothetical protein